MRGQTPPRFMIGEQTAPEQTAWRLMIGSRMSEYRTRWHAGRPSDARACNLRKSFRGQAAHGLLVRAGMLPR
jgi:hypothetical protein